MVGKDATDEITVFHLEETRNEMSGTRRAYPRRAIPRIRKGQGRGVVSAPTPRSDIPSELAFLDSLTAEEMVLTMNKYPSLDQIPSTRSQKYRELHDKSKPRAILGWFWPQLVFTAHDAGHMGITHNLVIDSFWHVERTHNVHHIVTNASYDAVGKGLVRYQAFLYYSVLMLGRFIVDLLIQGQGPRKGAVWWIRLCHVDHRPWSRRILSPEDATGNHGHRLSGMARLSTVVFNSRRSTICSRDSVCAVWRGF